MIAKIPILNGKDEIQLSVNNNSFNVLKISK